MTKAFSKVLAIILSVCVLFAVPVTANAGDATVVPVSGKVLSVNGSWENDYVETITIVISGDVLAFSDNAVVTVGSGSSKSNLFTINASDVSLLISPGSDTDFGGVTVSIPFNNYVSHAETYNFYFAEGTFVNSDGAVSEELNISVSGNDIIEAIEVEEVPVTPIQKLIVYLSGLNAEGFWKKLLDFLIAALTWFVNI